MAKKEREPDKPPSKAYLVSFGDTMTTLLAFFIVLNSLAEDQTGANLHAGTGSFMQVLQSAGLPGTMQKNSANAIQKKESASVYIGDPDPNNENKQPTNKGDSQNPNDLRSIDPDAEGFQRFLNEMERFSKVEQLPDAEGEVQFDFFAPMQKEPPYLGPDYSILIRQVIPKLKGGLHKIDIIVWATTPSPSAWQRAANQAASINADLVKRSRLKPEQQSRLVSMAQPWGFADERRPIVSIVVRKQEAGDRGP